MANQSETIASLAAALAKAQGSIKAAIKDSSNPHFKSRYADLASVWEACRQPLSENGLSVIQTTDETDGTSVLLVTTLAHSSGEWIAGRLRLNPVKSDPQGMGSAITYGRRYALAAIVGIAPDDDDGEAAQGRGQQQQQQSGSNGAEKNGSEKNGNGAPDKAKLLSQLYGEAKKAGYSDLPSMNAHLSSVGILPADLPEKFSPSIQQIQAAIAHFESEEAANRAFA